MKITKKQLRQIIKEELTAEAQGSNQEEIDKILDLIENDPEFQILGQFKDKFLKYMQSGGDPLSALEAASPERRPVQMALRKIRAVVKPQGPKTPMGMPVTEDANAEQARLQQGASSRRFEQDLDALIDEALDSGIPSQTIAEILQMFAGSV